MTGGKHWLFSFMKEPSFLVESIKIPQVIGKVSQSQAIGKVSQSVPQTIYLFRAQ